MAKWPWILAGATLGGAWVMLADPAGGEAHRDAIPAIVRDAITAWFPTANITGGNEEKEDEERIYEVDLRFPDGRVAEVEVDPPGHLLRLDREISEDQLPPSVREALNKLYQDASIKSARVITRFDVRYEVEVQAGRRQREVTVSRRGKILEIERGRR